MGAGLFNLSVAFKAIGEPAPTAYCEWCNISDAIGHDIKIKKSSPVHRNFDRKLSPFTRCGKAH